MLEDQDILDSEDKVKKFLLMVPDENLRSKLEGEMMRCNDTASRWNYFSTYTETAKKVRSLT